MSESVQVTVDNTIQRGKMYSLVDTEGQWYGLGFTKPTFNNGDEIQFEFTRNGKYMNIVDKSIKVISSGGGSSETTSKSPAKKGYTSTRDTYWEDKAVEDKFTQKEIRHQASRNAAIAWVNCLITNGLLPMPTKAALKEEQMGQYLDLYTNQFYLETVAVRDRGEEDMGYQLNQESAEGASEDDLADL